MKEEEEVEALCQMVGLDPATLVWMSQPPIPQVPANVPPRYQFVPLSDDEWEIISPHWPTYNQARTHPRSIVNALLKIAATGCGWNGAEEFATEEAARQQFRRRWKSGALGMLVDVLKGRVDDERHGQFAALTALEKGFHRRVGR